VSDTVKRRIRTRPTVGDDWPPARVSVVIPCYNYAHFLSDAANSALSQKDVEVDVIIVDDASTDNSAEVAHSLAGSDPRIRVIENQTNMGPVDTFNNGLEAVTGEFIVRLDADDMLTPGSLSRSVALAGRFPTAGLVYGHPVHFIEDQGDTELTSVWGNPEIISPGDKPTYTADVRSWTVWPGMSWLRDRCRTGFNVITSPEVLMRASVVDQVGGQKPLPHTHDMEMWLRMATVCDIGRVDGADQAWHRDHPHSLSSAVSDGLEEWRIRQLAFDTLLAHPDPPFDESKELHELSRRTIASTVLRQASHSFDRGHADPRDIARAEHYAADLYPEASNLPTWRGLQRRKRLHTVFPVNRSPYIASAVAWKILADRRAARWQKWGI
jgi:Glycosyl transferase family 2